MASGVGSIIQSNDYNSIKARVDLIFGSGSGQNGYGQTVTSTAVSATQLITHTEWSELRNDMVKVRQHQTGVSVGTTNSLNGYNLLIPAFGELVTEELRNQYDSFATTITSDKFLLGSTQYSTYLLDSRQRITEWNNTLSHVITITGSTSGVGSAENIRYFFNAGGNITISASRTGTAGSTKDTAWTTMLNDIGTITFNHQTTSSSGSGTGFNIGWFSLTTSDQKVFEKTGPTGFTSNKYTVYARRDSLSSSITFTIQFADLVSSGTDINVTGTLTSTLQQNTPTGVNVSIYPLTVNSGDSSFSGGTPLATYTITPSVFSITAGNTVTFSIHVAEIPVSSSLTWNIPTASGIVAADFVENTLTGGPFTPDGSGNYSFTLTAATYPTLQPSKTFYVEVLNNGSIVQYSFPVTITAYGSVYWSTPGSYTWTVPAGVARIVLNEVGGGGGGYGYHDGGYGTYASPGGPGGGISNLTMSVKEGTLCVVNVGSGGGSGYYNGGTGAAGNPTQFYYNNSLIAQANQGNQASGLTPGTPGGGVINISYSGGSVLSGSAGTTLGATDYGYSVWVWINNGAASINAAGTQAISPPSQVADQARAGRSEYHGWASVTILNPVTTYWAVAGTYTWTVPATVTIITVTTTGGGGSGSAQYFNGSSFFAYVGQAGGTTTVSSSSWSIVANGGGSNNNTGGTVAVNSAIETVLNQTGGSNSNGIGGNSKWALGSAQAGDFQTPATPSYGAGGGGGFPDIYTTYGGSAGGTGTARFSVIPGAVISITVGAGGVGPQINYTRGSDHGSYAGSGGVGYVSITY